MKRAFVGSAFPRNFHPRLTGGAAGHPNLPERQTMLFDVTASWSSPQADLSGPATADRLRLSLQAGPICFIPRTLPEGIAAALDGMEFGALPTCDVSGPRDRVRQAVMAAMAGDGSSVIEALNWLRDDILTLMDLYVRVTGARSIRTRLRVVPDDMGGTFYIDQATYRLLTTYRGSGTQWMSPRVLATAALNQPVDAGWIRNLDRGTVAILRGAHRATPDRPGVLHRSPPIAGSGEVRLFLSINEVAV